MPLHYVNADGRTVELHNLIKSALNSVAAFSATSAAAQSATYFIVLFHSGLAEAGQYTFYVAIAGLGSTILRPQFWMYLGLRDIEEHKRQLFHVSIVQKLAILVFVPPILLTATPFSVSTVFVVAFYAATFNCNYVNAEVRFSRRYSSVVLLNTLSIIVKLCIVGVWAETPHSMVLVFLMLDAALWTALAVTLAPAFATERREDRASKESPWKGNYFWGWLLGLCELPISSLDRLILGALSLELLGAFAFLKQVNSMFGMLNTYYANELFAKLRARGLTLLPPQSWPDLKAVLSSATLGLLFLAALYSQEVAALNSIFIPHKIEMTVFVLWCCTTVGFYHVHIGMNINGLTKEAFYIHMVANGAYITFVILATATAFPLTYVVSALIGQQLMIIAMKQLVLARKLRNTRQA